MFAQVKHQLSTEDHDKVTKGDVSMKFEGLSASEFIIAALDLERAQ